MVRVVTALGRRGRHLAKEAGPAPGLEAQAHPRIGQTAVNVSFYMDVHVPRAITIGLRMRGVDVLTAQDDGAGQLLDPDLLDRANSLGRLLVTQDQDFFAEAAARQANGIDFTGIIFVRQHAASIGQIVRELELIAQAGEPEDFRNGIEYLPWS